MANPYKPLKNISRRDFCQGLLIGSALTTTAWPLAANQATSKTANAPAPYPPALTGLRGAHAGSFETAHKLAWNGENWPQPSQQTDTDYDLIVVGAGISGLTAAYLFQQQHGTDKRILILDNHDDIGGHAKRNEFTVEDRLLVGYGGSQSIDTPSSYSPEASQLLRDIGIETKKFYTHFDMDFFSDHALTSGLFLNRDTFGKTTLIPEDRLTHWYDDEGLDELLNDTYFDQFPLSELEKDNLRHLLTSSDDPFKGMNKVEVKHYMKTHSYADYLKDHFAIMPQVLKLVDVRLDGIWGVGQDAQSAMESYHYGMPGFRGLKYTFTSTDPKDNVDEPYIFHFPDGNASVARLLLAKLCPKAIKATGMDDIVNAKLDYSLLDKNEEATRIRLNSTVVNTSNENGGVNITYVQADKAYKVRAKSCILACYNMIIPYLCSEVRDAQAEALAYQVKTPMAYVNVAIKNWQAFAKAGISSAHCPHAFFTSVTMDFPVSMGGYEYTSSPDEPTVLHMGYFPKTMYEGLSAREQFRLGRHQMLSMSYMDYEREITGQLNEMLGPYGFEASQDISAITVNRWPHGYAYEYMDLWDPKWAEGEAPHEIARKPIGNIHIANSDSEAFAYVDGAINAAYRAVSEISNV